MLDGGGGLGHWALLEQKRGGLRVVELDGRALVGAVEWREAGMRFAWGEVLSGCGLFEALRVWFGRWLQMGRDAGEYR